MTRFHVLQTLLFSLFVEADETESTATVTADSDDQIFTLLSQISCLYAQKRNKLTETAEKLQSVKVMREEEKLVAGE